MVDRVEKTEEEWRSSLSPEQYQVCRRHGTERAFTGKYWQSKDKGLYRCACCGNPLFRSETKYDSGTGWPSFTAPVAAEAVTTKEDRSFFMRRVEVMCAACDSHLGHVFPDGPAPSGLRFCMNSVSLELVPDDK